MYKLSTKAYCHKPISQKTKNPTHTIAITNIKDDVKRIAIKLDLTDLINTLPQKKVYITPKDHKANFSSNLLCCSINPTNSKIGNYWNVKKKFSFFTAPEPVLKHPQLKATYF